MGEAGIAVRPLVDFARQEIVRLARPATRSLGVAFGLHARSGHGEHSAFDAGFIHRSEPHLTEIGEAGEERLAFVRRHIPNPPPPIALQAGAHAVLLNRDLLYPCSSSLPLLTQY